jgi:CheY-like chemotaxis protein
MTSRSPADTRYPITCPWCASGYDALVAAWCDCLAKERSVVCPRCFRCLCAAPPATRQKFWLDAPAELWQRKLSEPRPGSDFRNPEPADTVRPLVLIVDDEPDIRNAAIRLVASIGYGVVAANDGSAGLEVARHYRPDLVLTDALMPKMDGREMCRLIAEDPEIGSPRLVVMTSLYTRAQQKHEAFKMFHIDDYLSKPLDPALLEEVLRRHLDAAPAAAGEGSAH